ncbi:MAG: anti-sigma factor family protein [Candidatus Methylomirabilia bacterium]
MDCQELWHEMGEWRHRRLLPDRARELEAHLDACPDCQQWERDEQAVHRLLTERLPRYAAPVRLAQQIGDAATPRQSWWWAPACAALAAAMLAILLFLGLPRPGEPELLQQLVHTAISEHTRALLRYPHAEAVPAALPHLMERTGVGFWGFFEGDEQIRLLGAEPVVLDGERGLALFYNGPGDHMITYLILPGARLTLPERDRVQIGPSRPMLARQKGYSVFVWKQESLACLLISDLVSESELARFREYFLVIRSNTDPYPLSGPSPRS